MTISRRAFLLGGVGASLAAALPADAHHRTQHKGGPTPSPSASSSTSATLTTESGSALTTESGIALTIEEAA